MIKLNRISYDITNLNLCYSGTVSGSTVTDASVDDVNKMMTISNSRNYNFEGTITQDKNFSGSVGILGPFSLSYVPPTGN